MTSLQKLSILFGVVGVSIALSAASCKPVVDQPVREAVDGNGSENELRARWVQWQQAGIRSYGFHLERSCFCPVESIAPARVEVRDGRVVSIRATDDGRQLPVQGVPTVDSLFRWAIREAGQNGHVEVTYDPLLSYPMRMVIGTLANDAGTAYHVADLVPNR